MTKAIQIPTDHYQLKPGYIVNPAKLMGKKIPQREWLVEGMIPHKTVTLLTGDGGLGKSLPIK